MEVVVRAMLAGGGVHHGFDGDLSLLPLTSAALQRCRTEG
jgi:hypothetical protein